VINEITRQCSCTFKVWQAVQITLHYVFIAKFGNKKNKIDEHLAKLQAKH